MFEKIEHDILREYLVDFNEGSCEGFMVTGRGELLDEEGKLVGRLGGYRMAEFRVGVLGGNKNSIMEVNLIFSRWFPFSWVR